MPFEIEYKINGRKVSESEWTRHIANEAKSVAVEELKGRVAKLRCPVHGRSPKVVTTTKVGDRVKFQIEACCDDMLKRAQEVAVGR